MGYSIVSLTTLTYQNLLFCRVPINSILRFIIRTYKKVGYGSLRYMGTRARHYHEIFRPSTRKHPRPEPHQDPSGILVESPRKSAKPSSYYRVYLRFRVQYCRLPQKNKNPETPEPRKPRLATALRRMKPETLHCKLYPIILGTR